MARPLLALIALPLALPVFERAEPESAPFHCQVPCGIYGDQMRIDMHMEDVATIRKGMAQMAVLESDAMGGNLNTNQIVRWVVTKEEHAAAIQERVASYWLAQRVKAPADDSAEARERYVAQLERLHAVTVAAMKCKQTADTKNADTLKDAMMSFAEVYFSAEDLAHIREHHGAGEGR